MSEYPMTPKVKELTGSRKKTFRLGTSDGPENVNSYWDGGSRSQYRVFNIDTRMDFVPAGNAPFVAQGRVGYTLIKGDLLIETGTFMGKPSWPRIICRTDDLDRVMAYLGVANLQPA